MHKVILAAHSDFFEALFSFEDKKQYKLKDVTQDVLKIILDCFYEINCFDKPINCYDDQLEVIATAAYLIAPILLEKAINFLMESLEEARSHQVSEILLFAQNFQIQGLEEQILTKCPPFKRRAVKSKQTRCYNIRRVFGMGDTDIESASESD